MSHTCGNCACKLCCCCGKRGATVFFALIGLLLAAGVIVPPVYVHETDRNYEKLFPILSYGREYLEEVTNEYFKTTNGKQKYEYQNREQYPIDEVAASTIEDLEMNNPNVHNVRAEGNSVAVQRKIPSGSKSIRGDAGNKYKLAIFQFLDDTQRITPTLAFISFCLGCLNVPLHLLLLGGAIFRQPCGLLPWLVFTFVEHVVIGVPLIVFFGLISLYLAAQLELFIIAGGLIGSVVLLFLLSLSSWCTVLGCYHQFGREEAYNYDALCQHGGGIGMDSTGSSRRSAHHTGEHSYIPPGHPSHHRNSGTGYRIHQGGYYPPHQSSRQLPPVPR